jgi:hypothetical protein
VNTWVLGGRFVEEKFKGEFNGMPFEGIGYTGYDNFKKLYTGSWMDNMGTMMMVMSGTVDPSGKEITMTGQIDDIMTGKPCAIKSVSRFVSKDQMTYEMWGPDPTGKVFKMMEIVYNRQ